MEKADVLLAHRNPIVLKNLAEEMRRRRGRAEICAVGSEAELMRAQCLRPARVVLVDLEFAQSERVLQCLAADPAGPRLYVCSDAEDEGALPPAAREGGWPVGLRGTPVGVICDQLENLLAADAVRAGTGKRRMESAQRLLFLAGVLPLTRGYRCLRLALAMVGECPALLDSLAGRLYPALALRCGGTPAGVERCMRYAVHQIWQRLDQDERLRLLPRCGQCPGVKQFLSELNERLDDEWLL